jgi:hypothetical protein
VLAGIVAGIMAQEWMSLMRLRLRLGCMETRVLYLGRDLSQKI